MECIHVEEAARTTGIGWSVNAAFLLFLMIFNAYLGPGLSRNALTDIASNNESQDAYKKLNADERKELIRQLDEHKQMKKKGRWVSHQSKVNDINHTISAVEREVCLHPHYLILWINQILLATQSQISNWMRISPICCTWVNRHSCPWSCLCHRRCRRLHVGNHEDGQARIRQQA